MLTLMFTEIISNQRQKNRNTFNIPCKNALQKPYDMDIKEKRSSKYSWNNQKTLIYDPYPTAITSLEFLSVTKLFTIALRPDSMT